MTSRHTIARVRLGLGRRSGSGGSGGPHVDSKAGASRRGPLGLGLEGALQKIERSEFRFPLLGSAVTVDF